MQIESLKVFCDLADSESFTKAAALNKVTQSAVSQQITAMERIFKSQLVERSKKQFRLTPEGQLVYEHGKQIVHLQESLFNQFQELKDVISGTIRVATIYSIGLYDLPPYVKKFMLDYPSVQIHVELLRNNEVYESILSNVADLGLVAYPERNSKLEIIPLRKDPLVLICHPQHAFAPKQSLQLKQLSGQNFISFKLDIPLRQALDTVLQKNKVEVEHVMEFDNVETLKRAVEIDGGVAIVPHSTILQEVAKNTLVAQTIEDEELFRPLAAIYRKNKVLSPAMKQFLKLLPATL
jgi:DNA-binding transcriptional LysR family regulator